MSYRHHHGYVISQMRPQSLWTKRCLHFTCGAIQPTAMGWAAIVVALVVIAVLLAAVVS